MAYRELRDGDLVRVVDKSKHHGNNAVVLDTSETSAYVQIHLDRSSVLSSECKWVNNSSLLIRDGGIVKDGRVDLAAQSLLGPQYTRWGHQDVDSEDESEDEYEDEYADWDRDELIERIKELEEVIENNRRYRCG